MKKQLFTIFMLIIVFTSNAQNLVPNPSFEDYTICPNNIGQINYATGWNSTSVESTPEYFNSCNTSGLGVPQNSWGFQNTFEEKCKGYCGEYIYLAGGVNTREYIKTHLISTLNIGTKYYCSMKVSLCETSDCATNNLGFLFSTHAYSFLSSTPPLNYSQIYSHQIIYDKINWTLIAGNFIADSLYNYLTIGNFFDDLHTDTSIIATPGSYLVYYFIDDVCVSTDSAYCYNYSYTCQDGIEDYHNFPTINFQNPVRDKLDFKINEAYTKCFIEIKDLLGKTILQEMKNNNENNISLNAIPKGIYFINFKFNNSSITKKLIIN